MKDSIDQGFQDKIDDLEERLNDLDDIGNNLQYRRIGIVNNNYFYFMFFLFLLFKQMLFNK